MGQFSNQFLDRILSNKLIKYWIDKGTFGLKGFGEEGKEEFLYS